MKGRWVLVLPLALLAAASAGGCAALTDASATGAGDGVQVAAAFYPLEYAAERVAGDHATVTDLTSPGGEPHDLEPSVAETAEIAQADVVVYERGFQPAVDAAVDENASGRLVDAAQAARLVPFRAHGVDSPEVDPHFWLDPSRLADVADAVADALVRVDPAHTDDYRRNAAKLRGDLRRLEHEYAAGLASCRRDTIVVSHDAFGYLQRFGIRTETILGLSPDSEPTPADLARLQDLIRRDGITTVFSETLAPKRTAEGLARDTGVRSAVLDPIEGLSDQTADEDYLSLMRANLAAIEEANEC